MGGNPSSALVFISYSSADRAIAEAACHSLEAAGIQCWIAPRDVKGARFYPSQIVQAIRRSQVFVLIFSEAANRSDHVLQELERATSLGIPILAVRLGAVTPSDSFSYFLGVRHWVEPPAGDDGTVDFSALPDHVKALFPEKPAKPNLSTEQDFEVFGHFRILRREDGSLFRLGKGGMGETFKARDTVLDRTVALKVISAGLLGSTSVRERFLREAKAAAKIQHPHVATVFHFGQEGDTYFYAMEFVDGEDLEKYVQTRGRLPVPLALRVAHQVAQGLEAADEQKLIHRDIKPSNIMGVWKKDFSIKLIDFGLAKNVDPRSLQESVLSGRGDFLGTVAYASPEQCRAAVMDVRSDIYSLGVTLWYLLAGERPFSGTAGELIGSHLYKSPPLEKLDGIPEAVSALLRRMLAKEPDARPQNPQALQEEIQKITNELANDFAISIKPPAPPPVPVPVPIPAAEPIESVAVDAPGFINYLTPAVGAVLGHEYRLEEEIGEGIGGRLFRVSGPAQAGAQGPLAAKLLHPALAQDPAMLSLLGSEIDLLLPAPNEHLIHYFAFEREASVPFFVREWVHGFSLLDLLRWKGGLPAQQVVGLLSGVAATLDFGSQRGLGLFEFTLRKSFVICPETVEPACFREFAMGGPTALVDCRLKLNPLSLAPLLFRNHGVWVDSTLLPDSRVQSLTQAAAGIEATKGVPLLARMIYELLGGPPFRERGMRSYTPLTAINEAGNSLLRRAILEPTTKTGFANCGSFWEAFTSSLDLPSSAIPDPAPLAEALPVEPQITPVPLAVPVEALPDIAPVAQALRVEPPLDLPPLPASSNQIPPAVPPGIEAGAVDSLKKSIQEQPVEAKAERLRLWGKVLAGAYLVYAVVIVLIIPTLLGTIHNAGMAILVVVPFALAAVVGGLLLKGKRSWPTWTLISLSLLLFPIGSILAILSLIWLSISRKAEQQGRVKTAKPAQTSSTKSNPGHAVTAGNEGLSTPQKRSLKQFPIWMIGVALALIIILPVTFLSLAIVGSRHWATPTPTPPIAREINPGRPLNVSFAIQNDTGKTITGFYVAPHGSERWGQSWLGAPLNNGAKRSVSLAPAVTADTWDIRIVYSNGNQDEYITGYDLAGFTYLDFTENEILYGHKNK